MISVRPLAAVAGTLLVGAFVFGAAGSASAHDGLIAASPSADSAVSTKVTEVSLEFSQDFLDLGGEATAFAVQVVGPDGRFYNTGCVALDSSRITTAAELGESGQYQVLWQIISSDGHPTTDTYVFTYEQPEGVTAATGSATGDTCGQTAEPEPEASETPAPAPTPVAEQPTENETSSSGNSMIGLGFAAGIALFVLLIVVILFARGRRKP